jgi:hypothetical protein
MTAIFDLLPRLILYSGDHTIATLTTTGPFLSEEGNSPPWLRRG